MLLLALSGTLLVLALFCFLAANSSSKGVAMPPQTDTLIYMQYARAIAEGHPYCYISGDTPTTGSTSHLYPLLLAIPYALGAQGEALYVVSLILNIACLLLIVVLVWFIACRITPETAGYAVFFAVLSGPLAYTVLQQSDIGVFTVLVLVFFAALLYERHKTAAVFLALLVWCRPEGFILAAATLGYGMIACWHPQRRRIFVLGLWGCGNVMGVLLLNKFLTGSFVFQSLAGKGYLTHLSLADAWNRSVADCVSLVTEFLFGLGHSDRHFYTLPIVGGVLVLTGLFHRLMRREDCSTVADSCWALGTFGALVLVATSGWQGFRHDRHIAWLFPFFAIYAAIGIRVVKDLLPRTHVWHWVGALVLLYQASTIPYFAFENAVSLKNTAARMRVVSEAHRLLPPEKSIIVTWFFGAAYLMPGRPFVCARGYVTPQYVAWRDDVDKRTNIEILRRHPELRGDYWLLDRNSIIENAPLCTPFVGRKISVAHPTIAQDSYFPSSSDLGLYEADWSSLSAPRTPLATNALAAVQGWQLVDELDVGYLADEKAHLYQTSSRLPNRYIPVSAATRMIGDYKNTEAARMVLGSDSFHIHTAPSRDVRVVMRTADNLSSPLVKKDDMQYEFTRFVKNIKIGPELHLRVDVDGVDAGSFVVSISTSKTVWSEVVLDLPASVIRRPDPKLTISGDHVAAYYWFYQVPDARRP